MKTILKFPLQIVNQQFVYMPQGAKILTAQMQDGALRLWSEVSTTMPLVEPRSILVYGTGHQMLHQHARYVDTVQIGDDAWHVYEELKP